MNDRNYFVIKRLHSLSGVVPTAGFVIFHLFENSTSVLGPERFNETVHTIRSLPYLLLLEIGLLLPILFHAVLGVYLSFQARPRLGQFPTRDNWMYFLQRVTGVILFSFIGYHVYTTRFAGVPSAEMFQYLAGLYSNQWISAFYALGIVSAAFHLSNGLFGFMFAWGIVTGEKSMDLAWKACMGLGLAVALMGLNALAGFHGKGAAFFFHTDLPAPAAGTAPLPEPAPGIPAPKKP